MALSQVYTAVAGHVITAARWNNEFGNIYANGTDVAFPLTKAVSLSGWTLTLDGAGATTLLSTASQGFIFSAGAKSGTPGVNGSIISVPAMTFTDTLTVASGTATLWAGTSFRIPTLAASNTGVTTTDAATVYIEGPPTAGTNETLTETSALLVAGKVKVDGELRVRYEDGRTNTVFRPITCGAYTTATPTTGIGSGIAFQTDSTDTERQSLGYLDFVFSDATGASEDSYVSFGTLAAGAQAETWLLRATTNFSGELKHSNAADRVYTLHDATSRVGLAGDTIGPTSVSAGSTRTHEGTVTISASQILEGIHYYTDFTLDAGDTLTMNAGAQRVIIVATGTITINGAITTTSGGSAGGVGGAVGTAGDTGSPGFSQPGGSGGANEGPADIGGYGGGVYLHSVIMAAGGAGTGGVGNPGVTRSAAYMQVADPLSILGGAGGGGGAGGTNAGASGGRGGGSIVLIAPTIVLGAASVLTTSGSAGGGSDNAAFANGAGGGGGAGNIYIYCQTFTDSGCTFVQAGGAGGSDGGPGFGGSAGADGVLQVNIYG